MRICVRVAQGVGVAPKWHIGVQDDQGGYTEYSGPTFTQGIQRIASERDTLALDERSYQLASTFAAAADIDISSLDRLTVVGEVVKLFPTLPNNIDSLGCLVGIERRCVRDCVSIGLETAKLMARIGGEGRRRRRWLRKLCSAGEAAAVEQRALGA